MVSRNALAIPAAILVACVALSGCGPAFNPPSEVDSLRVLAVQKDRPYAAPGDQINFKMLWTDGSEDAGRDVQIGWIAGCINPLGDLYANCFASGQFENPQRGMGDEFSFTLPDTIISSRPPPPDPRQPAYGLSYVFFAACAGNLDLSAPLGCTDSNGNALGSKDFVAGYTAIYAYDGFGNQNPVVRGLTLDGRPLSGGCVDPASAAAVQSGDLGALLGRAAAGSGSNGQVVVCDSAELGDALVPPDCTEPGAPCVDAPVPGKPFESHDIRPEVYRASIEDDAISKQAYGRDYEEQMWINYYTKGGSLRGDGVRLLNDATTGLNKEFATDFSAPLERGPVTLWAVVHDNRGGVAWARGTVWIR